MRINFDGALAAILFLGRLYIYAGAGTKILDFGCGEGAMVRRLRELGFEAYGFDIHDRVAYRSDEERSWFRFSSGLASETSNMTFDPAAFRIPFDDNTFDVVHSSSVIEHVLDLYPVMSECARVMRPDGITYHVYPPRLILVEPHVYVPLGGLYHADWWLKLWAFLGVRNQYQEQLSARQTFHSNKEYYKTGLRYYSRAELYACARRYFSSVSFPARSDVDFHDTLRQEFKQKLRALNEKNPLRGWAICMRLHVIACEGKVSAAE
jgi:SAM-dependent methyltransferase